MAVRTRLYSLVTKKGIEPQDFRELMAALLEGWAPSNLHKVLDALVSGRVISTEKSRKFYSHDASMFEVVPRVIVVPEDSHDVQQIVRFVADNKAVMPDLSITARSAGTDMSGGAINDSIILDFGKHFTKIGQIHKHSAQVQPGVPYRKFEKKTLRHHLLLPSYPASRNLCTVGGMVNNNSGGEKSLKYGKTEDYVSRLKVVLADGNEYTVGPIDKAELDAKMRQKDFEGKVYRDTYALIEKHYDQIKKAKPNVTKNSTGYNLWDVWDRETGIFDLSKLIVGAQGTLAMVTDINFKLVEAQRHTGMLVVFMPSLDKLGEVINAVLPYKPSSFESFDDHTIGLSLKFFPYFRTTLGWGGLIKLAFSMLPDALMLLRGMPKLILLIEFEGNDPFEIKEQLEALKKELKPFGFGIETADSEAKSRKYWLMRRESFNLLRHKVKALHTAPFIDDLVVPPKYLPEFLPKLNNIIPKYDLLATVAGHMGDGNFHLIPLMKLEDPKERAKLEPAMREVFDLVMQYHGSFSGEHNDGMIRGPFLDQQYGKPMVEIFRDVKDIFDPQNIFNPHKKVTSDWKYSHDHIRQSF